MIVLKFSMDFRMRYNLVVATIDQCSSKVVVHGIFFFFCS